MLIKKSFFFIFSSSNCIMSHLSKHAENVKKEEMFMYLLHIDSISFRKMPHEQRKNSTFSLSLKLRKRIFPILQSKRSSATF